MPKINLKPGIKRLARQNGVLLVISDLSIPGQVFLKVAELSLTYVVTNTD
jgi:hypothetical protein